MKEHVGGHVPSLVVLAGIGPTLAFLDCMVNAT
jgi:CRISPR/Cas system CMR-associated protein Cmr5 small subunit